MERILMHKNTPVAAIRVCGRKIAAASVLNRSLLPVGTYTEYPQLQPHLLSAWNAVRSIPDTRQEIASLKDVLPLEGTGKRSYGKSDRLLLDEERRRRNILGRY